MAVMVGYQTKGVKLPADICNISASPKLWKRGWYRGDEIPQVCVVAPHGVLR